jgi:hypothetical protein
LTMRRVASVGAPIAIGTLTRTTTKYSEEMHPPRVGRLVRRHESSGQSA